MCAPIFLLVDHEIHVALSSLLTIILGLIFHNRHRLDLPLKLNNVVLHLRSFQNFIQVLSIAQFFSKKGDKDELGQKSHIKVAEEEILNTDQTESLKQEPESGHVGHLCSPVRPESFTSTRVTDIKVEQDYDESGSKQSSTWQTGNPPEKVGILANDNVKSLEEVETEDIKPNVFGLPWEESGDSKTKRDYEEFSRNVMRLAKRVYKHLSPSKKKAKAAFHLWYGAESVDQKDYILVLFTSCFGLSILYLGYLSCVDISACRS
ncbi:hypothetical protein FXO38_26759, partial [Capsicum annuum]